MADEESPTKDMSQTEQEEGEGEGDDLEEQGFDQENNQIKMKMQKLLSENAALGDEVRGAQENLRLSDL